MIFADKYCNLCSAYGSWRLTRERSWAVLGGLESVVFAFCQLDLVYHEPIVLAVIDPFELYLFAVQFFRAEFFGDGMFTAIQLLRMRALSFQQCGMAFSVTSRAAPGRCCDIAPKADQRSLILHIL